MLIAVASLFACKGRGDAPALPIADTVADTAVALPRTSVTFIMGRDLSAYNPYYSLANQYYRLNPDDRTEFVVDSLTALSQVFGWLSDNPSPDGRPYGIVNIVSHGNEFVDLQMTVTPGGPRTSVQSLRQALVDSLLSPPDCHAVDHLTRIYLHGCAVGQNQPLLDLLAEAFGGRAVVQASKLFEYYAYLSLNRNPQSIRHYFARTWYAFYHPDSAYNETALVRQLRNRYPSDTTHWREGLRRRLQDNPSQLYHYSFTVPCLWDEVFTSLAQFPAVNSLQQRRRWVADNAAFRALLDQTHIPLPYFQIKFYRQTLILDNDSLAYGLRVRARAGVICLIQPLTAPDSMGSPFAPFRPSFTDTAFFAFSRPRYLPLPPSLRTLKGLPGSPVPPFL